MLFEMVTSFRREPVRSLRGVVYELVRTGFQMALLLLLIMGIGGIAYKSVSQNGWLLGILRSAWGWGPTYLLFVTLGIIASGAWLRSFMYRVPALASRTGDIMAAVFIGLGVFFCIRILNGGSL